MTLFTNLTEAETTSDTDEILVRQGLTYRRATLSKVRPSSLSVDGDSTTLTQTGQEVQTILDGAFAVEQSWQDMTASRSLGVTYTNTSDKAIFVSVLVSGVDSAISLSIDGDLISISDEYNSAESRQASANALVPSGSTYLATGSFLFSFLELR